ncbi:hypothetical protein [Inquilinus limosus]|uniref:Uncharacterized protein n=1 Tax=Inquilinus limosus TaxID=171674 RepID=A0A211ZH16_9PROT|nr:hypothetical protein [Inquilinus limosus]OWJ64569.1 hypothetical protein BWR60_23860 [Inquilinus limosus]
MFSFLRRRHGRRRPDGAEALLAMTPRELADLPFWVEPPQPDCADGAPAPRPFTARTAPRRQPA